MNRMTLLLIFMAVLIPLSNGQCYDNWYGGDRQPEWRYCDKCNGMFYDGYSEDKGVCPAGGTHVAIGYNFALPYDISENPCHQINWRYCDKCNGMFYDGYSEDKGVCPAGGTHVAIGYNFALPYDISEDGYLHQPEWRYCDKCNGMFYDGYSEDKGVCPAGGTHVAIGYNFALLYSLPEVLH